jgi:hypothetical protein
MKKALYFSMAVITFCLLYNLTLGVNPNIGEGTISGEFLENGKPCSLRINLHNAINKLYLRNTASNKNGKFVFNNLKNDTYYLITHPAGTGLNLPLQWHTDNIELNDHNPEYHLPAVDGWSVKILEPQDSDTFAIDVIKNMKPIEFSWTEYNGEAEYEIEIIDIHDQQKFNSGRIPDTKFLFKGVFSDGSLLKKNVYRWTLTVYPINNEWQGVTNFYDFSIGDLCSDARYEGTYIVMNFPKWYSSIIKEYDLIDFLDRCYLLVKELSAGQVPVLGPKLGEKQEFFYDKKIMFAHSGQPIHIGKKFVDGNNVVFNILLHEMAHNFQIGGLPGFPKLLLNENLDNFQAGFCFSEGLATLASMYAAERLSPEETNESMLQVIRTERKKMRDTYYEALNYYLESGIKFENLTPDVVDGMLYTVGDKYGFEVFPKFFKIFHENEMTKQIYKLAGEEESKILAVLVSALSAASEEDLIDDFLYWEFPIDIQFYKNVSPLIKNVVS